ncbi:ketopantoate reductase family protein [Bartonella sp. LJL80]
MTRVLILGAGGVGGYFGGRLAEAGHDVTFLVRPKRQKILAENGLRIESPAGNAKLQVKTVTQETLKDDYDFVFLTCKAFDLDTAIASIRPAIGEHTVLLPVLNGMAHIDRLNEEFGKHRVMAGCVVIQATLSADGVVKHLNNDALGFFGIQDGGTDPRASQWAGLFDNARGVKVRAVDDAMQRMWDKWVRLATLAGMTCMMRANIGEITRAYGGTEAITEFLKGNNRVATAEGYPLDAEKMNDTGSFLSGRDSLATASMLRDIEQGNATEGDHVLGDLLARAKKYDIKHPILSLAYTHIKAYDERRLSGRDR